MKAKLAKLAFVLLALAILSRLLWLVIQAANHHLSNDTTIGWTIGAIIALIIFIIVFAIVDRLRKKYQRAVQKLSQTSEAYICELAYSNSYRILSADSTGVTLCKLQGGKPHVIRQWPWSNLSLQKAPVNVTAVRAFDGLQLTDQTDQSTTELVLYSHASGVLSRPIVGPNLDDIIQRWRQKLAYSTAAMRV